ncbi:MAG: response regulator [Acidimicrobiaceae bacterium]|jgi:response regulator NasT|nr:response regulator [Acidimicrobiaceae bacterium]|tara:strand:- start:995 stop:1573 length:579 start_codon:yes stop_codon:yes gene_type:complete
MEKIGVVIAEDEAIIRLDLRETLENAGYEVVADTGRGDEAVKLVSQYKPEVVILDVKMPGMDGIQAAREIAATEDTAVVILTAFSQRELIDEAVDAGALAYLVKPYQQSDLVPAIEIARRRHQEMRELTDQAKTLEERLKARKVIEKAKGLLIETASLTEDEAFRFIQTTAMSERKTMLELAEKIISEGLRP